MGALYTIGHGTRSVPELLTVLNEAGVRLVVDVRRHPAWRNASFRAYAGYMDSPKFRGTFDRLLALAVERSTAIMCAETLWWRCHRRLIADAAVLRGVDVVHLLGPGQTQSHPQHPSVRADDDGRPVYDVGTNPELFVPEP